jgi:large subunit ribosomal protein LP2
MRHLAAYLLLTVGGNAKPTVEEVTAVLGQAGIETDSERLSALFAELEGKDVEELIALGKEKLMKGGAMAASAAPAAAGAGKH